jgi:uncharacterized membrane protein
VLFNVAMNYALAVHRYAFIYFTFAAIIIYSALLWFFHNDFYQVISMLFGVTSVLFILTMFSLRGEGKMVQNAV